MTGPRSEIEGWVDEHMDFYWPTHDFWIEPVAGGRPMGDWHDLVEWFKDNAPLVRLVALAAVLLMLAGIAVLAPHPHARVVALLLYSMLLSVGIVAHIK